MTNDQHAIVGTAAAHVDEGVVFRPFLVWQRPAAGDDRRHHCSLIEECTLWRTRKIEVQTPELVRRQPLPLLLDILAALRPRVDRGVRPQFGFELGEGRIGAEVAAVPREQHARIGAGLALGLEVGKRNAGRRPDGIVAGHPHQSIGPRRIGSQGFEQIIVAIAVDFIEANERGGFAVQADDIARG